MVAKLWEEQLTILLNSDIPDLQLLDDLLVTYEVETGDNSMQDVSILEILAILFPTSRRYNLGLFSATSYSYSRDAGSALIARSLSGYDNGQHKGDRTSSYSSSFFYSCSSSRSTVQLSGNLFMTKAANYSTSSSSGRGFCACSRSAKNFY